MNFQTLKDYFQEFIECEQHKIMFLNRKYDIFEEFKVIDAINFLEEKDKELELERKSRKLLTDDLANVCKMSLKKDNIIKEAGEYVKSMTLYNNNKCDTGMKDYQCTHLLEIIDKVENK